MYKTEHKEQQPQISIDKIGEEMIVTVNLKEITEIRKEILINEGEEVEEEITYWLYNTNTFKCKYDEKLIENIKNNPILYLFYGKEFEKQKKDIVDAVQKLMDDTAKTRNYDDIFTAISYKDSAVEKFKKEAEACLAWRDLVWVTCYEILDEVVTLKRELPSLEEILEELPKIDW